MAKDNSKTNREQVQSEALSLVFAPEKAQPLMIIPGMTEKGSITWSSCRKYVGEHFPELTGDVKTVKVNELRNSGKGAIIAAISVLSSEGFNPATFKGRTLKNGARSATFRFTDAPDRAATPAKKIGDYTSSELLEMAEKKAQAESAVTIEA
jgi:hypothetical protein